MSLIEHAELAQRVERTRERMASAGLDALLVVGRSFYDRCGNLAYLTNHLPPYPASAVSGDLRGLGHAFLVLPARGSSTLVIDMPSYRRELVAVDDVRVSLNLSQAVAQVLQEQALDGGMIGLVGEDILPLVLYRDMRALLPAAKIEPCDWVITEQRRLKSPAEIVLLRRAAAVADAALKAALAAARPGVSELEVSAAGTAAGMAAGADFVRYVRVHSGEWSAWSTRWAQATDRRLKEGDLVTIDVIGARSAYQFDVLRTMVVGPPSPDQLRALDALRRLNERVVAAARPGVRAGDLVLVAQRDLEAAGYGKYASRFIGHGIGLETAEEPFLNFGSGTILEPGMVVCIEPGIYIPGWGGCNIEQEVIVSESGPEVITPTLVRNW
jgi:Xaa-Pro dipeptidase